MANPVRLDSAFVDGHHLFDDVVMDYLSLGHMPRKGCLLVFRMFRRVADPDPRDWDRFVPS